MLVYFQRPVIILIYEQILYNQAGKQAKLNYSFIKYISVLSAVTTTDASSSPAALTPKKDYVYETKEEAKQAFKELLKEKVITNFIYL